MRGGLLQCSYVSIGSYTVISGRPEHASAGRLWTLYAECDALASSRARICLAMVRRASVPLRALRYSSLLRLRAISRLSASIVSCRCSTSSRMISTAVGLTSISMGTSPFIRILPKQGRDRYAALTAPQSNVEGYKPNAVHLLFFSFLRRRLFGTDP